MSSLLTACGDKDTAYYLKNIDKAKEKSSECSNKVAEAFLKRDTKLIEKLGKDKECLSADEALKEHKRLERERKKAKQEAKEKAELEKAKSEISVKYQGLDWKQAVTQYVNSECNKKFFIGSDDYHCKAEQSIYDENVAKGKLELEKLDYYQLMEKESEYCSRDKRNKSTCSVWGEVLSEAAKKVLSPLNYPDIENKEGEFCQPNQEYNHPACQTWREINREKEQALVEQYVADYDSLRKDYNHCVEQLKPLIGDWQKYSLVNKISSSYPCKQARNARIKLGLSSDFKQPME